MMDWSHLPKTAFALIFQHLPTQYVVGTPTCCSLVCSSWRESALEIVKIIKLEGCASFSSLQIWLEQHSSSIRQLHAGNVDVDQLAGMAWPSLRDLQLHGASLDPISCQWLHKLITLPGLVRLNLHNITLTVEPDMCAVLIALPQLEQLSLRKLRKPDPTQPLCLAYTVPCSLPSGMLLLAPNLTKLELGGDPKHGLPPAALQGLESLSKLQHLVLEGVDSVAASALSCVQVLQQLTFLQLEATPLKGSYVLDNTVLPGLSTLTALQHLHFSTHIYQSMQPSVLAGVTGLKNLCLQRFVMAGGAAGVAELLGLLPKMQQLTHLDLSHALTQIVGLESMPAAAFSALTASSNLRHLDLAEMWAPPDNVFWQHVFPANKRLMHLTKLELPFVSAGLSTDDINNVVQCCPALQQLNLARGLQPGVDLFALRQLSRLTSLTVTGCTDVKTPVLAQLTQLQRLVMAGFNPETDKDLQRLTGLHQLTSLHVSRYGNISHTLRAAMASRGVSDHWTVSLTNKVRSCGVCVCMCVGGWVGGRNCAVAIVCCHEQHVQQTIRQKAGGE